MDEEKVYINPDGYYPQCKKCGYFDLEYLQEYCPQCGCKQDWSDILRLKKIAEEECYDRMERCRGV